MSVKHFKVNAQAYLGSPEALFFPACFDCKHALLYVQTEMSIMLLFEREAFVSSFSSIQCDFYFSFVSM